MRGIVSGRRGTRAHLRLRRRLIGEGTRDSNSGHRRARHGRGRLREVAKVTGLRLEVLHEMLMLDIGMMVVLVVVVVVLVVVLVLVLALVVATREGGSGSVQHRVIGGTSGQSKALSQLGNFEVVPRDPCQRCQRQMAWMPWIASGSRWSHRPMVATEAQLADASGQRVDARGERRRR
jgi:hypothetical protein